MNQVYELRGVGMRYGSASVLHDVSFDLCAGELVTIAGPNGAGKSTLIHVMTGLLREHSGECKLFGKDVRSWDRKSFARRVSVVPQSVRIDFGFTAEQVVLMGRTPFVRGLFESQEDHDAVARAMETTETLQFRQRDFRSLSGGEKQRVVVASALAQSPEVLLLDEPTTYLDIEHQISLYRLLRRLRDAGVLVVAVSHDLNLATTYSDRVLLLKSGSLVANGHPHDVLTAATIEDVFRVPATVEVASEGRRWIHYAL